MTSLQLVADQQLIVEKREARDLIYLLGPKGNVSLTIEVMEKGAVVRFDGPALALELAGPLAIDAERISLHGRQGVSLSSGGSASIQVEGDLESSARIQTIRAELGNVNIQANDDVRLNGEQVLLNC